MEAMGNREDLLTAALECLKTTGWARTTVRDIAAAAGVNHAAIGYHFGSRESLLTEAMLLAMEEWGGEIERAVRASVAEDASPREKYEAFWRTAIASYGDNRKLWLASVEAVVEAEYSPRVKKIMAEGIQQGRSGLAAGLLGVPEEDVDELSLRTMGSIQMALMSGILVQWTLDPARSPTADEISAGLAAIAESFDVSAPRKH
jgi:AcrR family transcriptional regulator